MQGCRNAGNIGFIELKNAGYFRPLERNPQIRCACGPVVDVFINERTPNRQDGDRRGGGSNGGSLLPLLLLFLIPLVVVLVVLLLFQLHC